MTYPAQFGPLKLGQYSELVRVTSACKYCVSVGVCARLTDRTSRDLPLIWNGLTLLKLIPAKSKRDLSTKILPLKADAVATTAELVISRLELSQGGQIVIFDIINIINLFSCFPISI